MVDIIQDDPNEFDAAPDQVPEESWDQAVTDGGGLEATGSGLSPYGTALQSTNFIEGESGWRLDSNGEADLIGLEAFNVKILQTFEAAETMGAGTPVGVNTDGQIAQAVKEWTAISGAPTMEYQFQLLPTSSADVFVYVYGDNDSAVAYVYARTVTISGTGVTLGTAYEVSSNSGISVDDNWSVCDIGDDKYVLVLESQVGSENVWGRVFSRSGTTITGGTQQTITTTDNLAKTACCSLGDDRFAWVGYRTNFGDFEYGTCTVSGTTISNEYTDNSGPTNIDTSSANQTVIMGRVAAQKFAFFTVDTGYCAVIDCDGALTEGTAVDITDTDRTTEVVDSHIVSTADDTFWVKSNSALIYCTVSSTTVTKEDEVSRGAGCTAGGLVKHGTTLYDVRPNATDSKTNGLWTLTQSGGTISATQVSQMSSSTPEARLIASDGTTVIAIDESQNLWLSKMAGNFIGFLDQAVVAGDTARVLISGIDSNQSGLLAGGYYLVDDGALTAISPTETVDTLDDVVNVVKAISTTQVLI